jgi:hypothetical protein
MNFYTAVLFGFRIFHNMPAHAPQHLGVWGMGQAFIRFPDSSDYASPMHRSI